MTLWSASARPTQPHPSNLTHQHKSDSEFVAKTRYVWQGSPRDIAAKTRRAVCVMSLRGYYGTDVSKVCFQLKYFMVKFCPRKKYPGLNFKAIKLLLGYVRDAYLNLYSYRFR